jgi:hypothetical protein
VNRLNARQADAVRVEWDESQEASRSPAKRARTSRDTAKTAGSRKSAKTARKNALSEHENQEDAVEDEQPAADEETAEERRRRKGKAAVRSRPPAAQRPSWEAVPPKQRLVSDEEASNPQDSDFEVSGWMSRS